jgi:hypothetical protein
LDVERVVQTVYYSVVQLVDVTVDETVDLMDEKLVV